ncbi:MAG: cadherin-like domain-containing protein [Acidimicrobiales bacterium]|nr:cadherin-like domain-containing protein [Acidimicrobiales bacterium]
MLTVVGTGTAKVMAASPPDTWSITQSSPPTAATINAISCTSMVRCVAVGVNDNGSGAALWTSDGNNWNAGSLPQGIDYMDAVSCPTATICFAIGITLQSNGHVLSSVDGGMTWNFLPFPSGDYLYSLSCPTAQFCAAVGDAANGDGVLATTSDSGVTWKVISEPAPPNSADTITTVSCSSATFCMALGTVGQTSCYLFCSQTATVEETTDGGVTWTGIPYKSGNFSPTGTAVYANEVSCVAPNFCAVSWGTLGPSASYVSYTPDGGATWFLYQSPGKAYSKGISCASRSYCALVGGSNSGEVAAALSITNAGSFWAATTIPETQINHLSAISCPFTSQCIATGDRTNGFHTVAASISLNIPAASYSETSLPTVVGQLAGISCSTASDCVAVGQSTSNSAVAIVTSNGGASWSNASLSSGVQDLSSVSCVASTRVCAAIGTFWKGSVESSSAVYSSDGGNTWAKAMIPPNIGALLSVSCASTTFCAAVGGTVGPTPLGQVVISVDGGATWSEVATPTGPLYYSSISCVTASFCVAAGIKNNTSGAVISTSNAGATWALNSFPSSLQYPYVSCASVSSCVLVTNTSEKVLLTTDGGLTWVDSANPAIFTSHINSVDCPSSTNCIAVVQGGSSNLPAIFYFSAFSNQSWTSLSQSNASDAIFGVSCIGSSSCIAVGSHTTNCGVGCPQSVPTSYQISLNPVSWTVHTTERHVTNISSVSCSSATHCVALGQKWNTNSLGAIAYTTTDGGNSWQVSQLPSDVSVLNEITCLTDTNCVAVGSNMNGMGLVIKTVNGGASWSEATLPAEVNVISLSCPTASSCVAIGQDSSLTSYFLYSLDGGSTWKTEAGLINVSKTSVTCPTATHCVAVGSGNGIAGIETSSDGGITWTSSSIPNGINTLKTVSCPDQVHCMALADQQGGMPVALVSSDGGTTWTQISFAPSDLYPTDVSCVNALDCVASLSDQFGKSSLYVTVDGGNSWSMDMLPTGVFNVSSVTCQLNLGCLATGTGNEWNLGALILKLVPEGQNFSYSTQFGTELNVNQVYGVLANTWQGTAIDGNTNPSHGSLVMNADGSFSYTPNAGFSGVDSFAVTITSPNGSQATNTVTLNVLSKVVAITYPNNAPVSAPVNSNVLPKIGTTSNVKTLAMTGIASLFQLVLLAIGLMVLGSFLIFSESLLRRRQ